MTAAPSFDCLDYRLADSRTLGAALGYAEAETRFEDGGTDRVRTRAWSGEALVCHAYYEPISGYEADEFPSEEDIDRPITFWLAPVHGGDMHVPVRIRTNAGFGGVTVVARSIEEN